MSLEDIKKDPIIKSIFDEGGLEQPSGGFTNNIINAIKTQTENSVFVYKPVISRGAWLVITFLGISLFAYLFFGFSPEGKGLDLYGYTLNFDTSIIKGIFSKFSFSFNLSPIFKIALMALSFFTFSNLIIFELKSRSILK